MMVYILLSEESGGVYAAQADDGTKVVQMFAEQDDAERFLTWLEADDKAQDLKVQCTEKESVIGNCQIFGYSYSIIKPNEFVIPQ